MAVDRMDMIGEIR